MSGIAILFLILGAAIKYGKLYFLIAGYNTMSDDEKKSYDIEAIANLFWLVMLAMALLIILGYVIAVWIDNPVIEQYAFWIALIVGIPYLLIRSNSKEFKLGSK